MAARFTALLDGLKGESDRGCVVLAIAWIEDDLTRVLKRFLLPSTKTHDASDELFGAQGYLGTFSAKIDLAYRLGLIQRQIHQSLHLCRRIRNDFAHLSDGLSFATRSVNDRVVEIFRLNEKIIQEFWEKSAQNVLPAEVLRPIEGLNGIKSFEQLFGTRRLFEITAGTIVAGLTMVSHELIPIQSLSSQQGPTSQ